MIRQLSVLFVFGVLFTASAGAAEDLTAPDWSDIGPIFAERCVMCHSAQGAGRGLRLDSYAFAVAGSSDGPVLIPGDADASELVRRLRGESLPRMPFLSYPLSAAEIGLIIDWVEAGLPE
jgi:mono/diheme cytochrome c family protein